VVWGERVKGSDMLTVNLGGDSATVKVYDPTIGTTATRVLTNVNSIDLVLTDHPLILEFNN
jgi:hypothetical protein